MSTSIFRVDEIMIFLNESPFVYNLGNSRTIRRLWGNYLRTFCGGLVFLREKGCVFMLSDGGFSIMLDVYYLRVFHGLATGVHQNKSLGSVHPWCPGMLPEYGSRWSLM